MKPIPHNQRMEEIHSFETPYAIPVPRRPFFMNDYTTQYLTHNKQYQRSTVKSYDTCIKHLCLTHGIKAFCVKTICQKYNTLMGYITQSISVSQQTKYVYVLMTVLQVFSNCAAGTKPYYFEKLVRTGL